MPAWIASKVWVMDQVKLFKALAFAGTLPFVGAALLAALGIMAIPPFGSVSQLASSYGLAITSFIAGTHWAVQILNQAQSPFNLLVSSNIVVVVAWLAYLVLATDWVLAVQAAALLLLLVVDHRLFIGGVISLEYLRTRLIATLIATLSLIVILLT